MTTADVLAISTFVGPIILALGWFATGYVVFGVLDRDVEDTTNWLLLWFWPITWILASPMIVIAICILTCKGLGYFGRYLKNVFSLYGEVIKR